MRVLAAGGKVDGSEHGVRADRKTRRPADVAHIDNLVGLPDVAGLEGQAAAAGASDDRALATKPDR